MSRFEIDPTRLQREVPVTLTGASGSLEGLWRPRPEGAPPRGVVVVTHPHPAYGGTMRNKVVFHLARMFNHDLGLATLRFNFRGVEGSAGSYDQGQGEQDDVRTAWAEARRRVPDGVLVAAGFSFGAAMTLSVAAAPKNADPHPAVLALIGLPLRLFPFPVPTPPAPPLAAVHGGADEFTPDRDVAQALTGWPGRTAFHVEEGADHFLTGRLPEAVGFLSRTVDGWLREAEGPTSG